MQVEQKLDCLLNSVSYIQDQSDQAISLGDQAAHNIGDIITHLDGIESRIRALETSTIINVPATATRVPKELSDSVKKLYATLEKDQQFHGEESNADEHNQSVATFLITQVMDKYGHKHTEKNIKKAVHRYYESRCRMIRDSLPGRKYKTQKILRKCNDKKHCSIEETK